MADQIDPTVSQNAAASRQQLQRLGVILGIMFALLAAGYYFILRMDYEPLFEGLKPADASAVISQLSDQGVRYRLDDDGTTILVEAGKRDEARLGILGSDISSKGLVGFELFDQSEMGLTDFAQKIKYQRALQGELARSITMMEGIDAARVHVAIPERSMFRGSDAGPTAAVTISTADGEDPAPESVEGIRQLVAASVSELVASSVVVLNEQGRILSAPGPGESGQALASETDTSAGGEREIYYREKVTDALDTLLGKSRADVVLSLETIPVPNSAGGQGDAGLALALSPTERLHIAVISDAPIGAEDRARIQGVLATVLPGALYSPDTLSFLDRDIETAAFSMDPDRPGSGPIMPLLHRVGLSGQPEALRVLVVAVGAGVLIFFSLLVALLFRRRPKGLTPEEHQEFAQLLKLEFAPSEEVAG